MVFRSAIDIEAAQSIDLARIEEGGSLPGSFHRALTIFVVVRQCQQSCSLFAQFFLFIQHGE
jgi:hypothetical protein